MAVGASSLTSAPGPERTDEPDGPHRPNRPDGPDANDRPAPDRRDDRRSLLTSWAALLPFLAAALPLGLLASAAWLGRHVRPSADEWCFLPVVREDGISGLIGKFWFTDNGRLGNGLLVGLYAQFPIAGHQWYGAVSGLVTVVVIRTLVARVLRRTGQQVRSPASIAGSLPKLRLNDVQRTRGSAAARSLSRAPVPSRLPSST